MEMLFVVVAYYCISCIIHEYGHYFVARRVGITPTIFKIGMGPVVFERGIVQVAAMPVTGRVSYSDAEFYGLLVSKQNAIILAGPAINIITGAILLPVFPLFGILSITVGCSNLIPVETPAGTSDGGFLLNSNWLRWPVTISIATVVIFLVSEILKLV